jgi:hypothetical protein
MGGHMTGIVRALLFSLSLIPQLTTAWAQTYEEDVRVVYTESYVDEVYFPIPTKIVKIVYSDAHEAYVQVGRACPTLGNAGAIEMTRIVQGTQPQDWTYSMSGDAWVLRNPISGPSQIQFGTFTPKPIVPPYEAIAQRDYGRWRCVSPNYVR